MTSSLITIPGERVLLRPLRQDEIDAEWAAMLASNEVVENQLPDESAFRARLARSGRLVDGWLDLAIDVGGESVGRIQTFVPADRADDSATYNIGIGLRPQARGHGYASDALAVFTRWLFAEAGASRVEGRTDPRNSAMRRVFDRLGWLEDGRVTDGGREWLLYAAPVPVSGA